MAAAYFIDNTYFIVCWRRRQFCPFAGTLIITADQMSIYLVENGHQGAKIKLQATYGTSNNYNFGCGTLL